MNQCASLDAGLAALGLNLSRVSRERLLAYLVLLEKWNRTYNLTAIRDRDDAIPLHLLDSLAVSPYVREARLIDVGSGGGLPGIPLAIARPEIKLTLVEAVTKKASFLQQAKIELKLDNIEVRCERIEKYRPTDPYPAAISRAFAELGDFVKLTDHLVAPGGRWLAMKGVYPEAELARLPVGFRVSMAPMLSVPQLGAERHLVILERS